MSVARDVLFLRRPKLDYVSPPVCETIFSGSGSPVITLDPFDALNKITGIVVEGGDGSTRIVTWPVYPGAICYTIYLDNDGELTVIAECVDDTTLELPDDITGPIRIAPITPDGEGPVSDPIELPPGGGGGEDNEFPMEGLIGYWEFENNFLDSHDSKHWNLSNDDPEIPDPTFSVGKVGQRAVFINGEFCARFDDEDFNYDGTSGKIFTAGGWFSSANSNSAIIFQVGRVLLVVNGGNYQVEFQAIPGEIVETDTVPDGTTHFFVFHYNSITQSGWVEVDRGTRFLTVTSPFVADNPTGVIGLAVGDETILTADQAFLFNRLVSDTELDYLFNSNNGRQYNT